MSVIRVATLNAGSCRDKLVVEAAKDLNLAYLGGQEFSDQNDLEKDLRNAGFMCFQVGDTGGPATPVFWDPKQIRVTNHFARLLLDRTNIGPGAGPSYNKPKYETILLAQTRPENKREEETRLYFGNSHVIPSLYMPRRGQLGREMNAKSATLAKTFKNNGRTIIKTLDGNAQWTTSNQYDAYKRIGLTTTHKQQDQLVTHRKTHRAIDHIINNAKCLKHGRENVESDHYLLWADLLVGT